MQTASNGLDSFVALAIITLIIHNRIHKKA